MRTSQLLVIVSLCVALCHTAPAGEEQTEPALTIVFDHAKLTKWVLEDFADGLPFDKTGKPTDDKKAKQFWELIADWPVNVAGEVTGLAPAMSQVCDEAGLPLYFTPVALEALEKAGTAKRMVSISDSVRKTVVIIGRLGGVEKTIVMPFGLIVLGPGEGKDIKQLVAAPPRLMFRWRANYAALLEKAFPDGLNREEATDDELKKVVQIATGIRCDLIVPGEVELEGFLKWFVTASQQTFNIDQALFESAEGVKRKIGPVECRFNLFLDAVNAALEGTGLEAKAEGTHFVIAPAEAKNTFLWREDWHEKCRNQEPSAAFDMVRLLTIILETRCDLIVGKQMTLPEFFEWFTEASRLNVSFHPFTLYAAGRMDLDEMHEVLKELPDNVDYVELRERQEAERTPAVDVGEFVEPVRTRPVVLRNVKVRDVLNRVLADFDLMVMASSVGQIRIVPRGLTNKELEKLRRQDTALVRSRTGATDQ